MPPGLLLIFQNPQMKKRGETLFGVLVYVSGEIILNAPY